MSEVKQMTLSLTFVVDGLGCDSEYMVDGKPVDSYDLTNEQWDLITQLCSDLGFKDLVKGQISEDRKEALVFNTMQKEREERNARRRDSRATMKTDCLEKINAAG